MYRIRTVFTGPQGSPWLGTMFFDETVGTAQSAATAVGTFWGAVDALMHTTVTWATEADVSAIDDTNGQLMGVSSTTPQTGTGALGGELAPFVSQALVRWRTNGIVNGRSLRGRSFVPGLTTTSADDGRVIAATQATINAAAAALILDANSTLVVWHRPSGPGATDGNSATVVTGTCWSQYASLRSRRD